MNNPKPIQRLPQDTARKIAAGEVIDRPAAIVRELMDNAIDANAKFVTVEIEEGGIAKIRVRDDGFGMTKEDLESCAYPHATNKIVTDEDLLSLNTLGFRGEALASIAAVSRLEITSIRQGGIAYKNNVHIIHRITGSILCQGIDIAIGYDSLFHVVDSSGNLLEENDAFIQSCSSLVLIRRCSVRRFGSRV